MRRLLRVLAVVPEAPRPAPELELRLPDVLRDVVPELRQHEEGARVHARLDLSEVRFSARMHARGDFFGFATNWSVG